MSFWKNDYGLTFDYVNERNVARYDVEMNVYGDEVAMIDMHREELYNILIVTARHR